MRNFTKIVVPGALLLAFCCGLTGAAPLDGQDQSRTREEGSGRTAGTRQHPDQPIEALNVDALVQMSRPSPGPLRVGDSLTLEIKITSRHDIGHAPFHVRFDPAVLRFESGEEGAFLGADGTQTAFFSNATSQGDAVVVGLSRLGRGNGAEGAGRLCTLHFTAVGSGDAAIEFARASVRDGYNRILKSSFAPTPVRVQ